MICPKCGRISNQIKAGFNSKGIQRYKCKFCNFIYTEDSFPKQIKVQKPASQTVRPLANQQVQNGEKKQGCGCILIFGLVFFTVLLIMTIILSNSNTSDTAEPEIMDKSALVKIEETTETTTATEETTTTETTTEVTTTTTEPVTTETPTEPPTEPPTPAPTEPPTLPPTQPPTNPPAPACVHFIINTETNCIHINSSCSAAQKILPENFAEIDIYEDELPNYYGTYWACGICSRKYKDILPNWNE